MTPLLRLCAGAVILGAACPALHAQDGDKAFTNSVGMKLTLIPPGKFKMGSPAGEVDRDPEELQHEVAITKPFYLGVYEVTQGQFEKVAGRNPSFFKLGADHPVEQVKWSDAKEFCKTLSDLPAEKKAGRRYRLPTEAEWEYAGRAGTTTAFSFGDALSSDQANIDGRFPYGERAKGTNLQKTAKVGSYKPNAWGLFDMHGNVAEWCSDFYDPDYYKDSPHDDPKGPAKGVVKTGFGNDYFTVLRGGSWLDPARGCRSAYRFRLQPIEAYRIAGFRVACEIAEKQP